MKPVEGAAIRGLGIAILGQSGREDGRRQIGEMKGIELAHCGESDPVSSAFFTHKRIRVSLTDRGTVREVKHGYAKVHPARLCQEFLRVATAAGFGCFACD